jgi:outer membrane protein assembly factor BamC
MRLVVLIVLVNLMTGCSWLVHDRTNDYLKSEIQGNISVPKDVARVTLTPRLAIPDVKVVALPEEFIVPRPASMLIEAKEEDTVSLASLSSKDLEAELVKDGNGTPILRLNVAFARAWSEIGSALKVSEVSVTDLNRSVGTYYIEVIDTEVVSEVGFWAGLFGSEPEVVQKPLQLKVNRARSGVYVAVHIDQDNLAEDEDAKALLSRLQGTLLESNKVQN